MSHDTRDLIRESRFVNILIFNIINNEYSKTKEVFLHDNILLDKQNSYT